MSGTFCGRNVDFVVAIMMHGWAANVLALDTVVGPSFFCWAFAWYAMTFVPRGARGVLLKSKLPKSWLYAESLGFSLEGRNMLSVATACGIRQHLRWGGKRSSVPFKMEMKWLLNVLIARSARLWR